MNIYLLNTIKNGKLVAEILTLKNKVTGIIGIDENGEGKTNEYYDYSEFCDLNNLRYVPVTSYGLTKSEDRELLEKIDIDLLLVVGWQRLIPGWLIKHCKIGVIGVHGSHEGITRGRGRSPQNWALLTGKQHFIFSVFWIEEGADDGDVIDTDEFEYSLTDNIMTSYIKLNLAVAKIIIKNLENGRIANRFGTPQRGESAYLPQRKRDDGMIDWNRDANNIYNFIRALSRPYPGAYTKIGDTEFVIETAIPIITPYMDLLDDYNPGEIIEIIDGCALVKCRSNILLIKECSNLDKLEERMVFESANYYEQMQNIVNRHKRQYKTPLSDLILNELLQ